MRLTSIADQIVRINEFTDLLFFTVSDAPAPERVQVFASASTNQKLVPLSNTHVQLGGTGCSRAMIILPVKDEIGSSEITVCAKDEAGNTATTSFILTVLDPRTDPSSLPSNDRGPLTNGPEEKSLAQGSQFYSCFISYSSKDEIFAKRLHSDLCACGITCFFAPEDLQIGAKLRSDIDKAIRLCDKVLIVLSEHSIESGWVEKEVEAAFEKERQQNCLVLFPIRLDDAVMSVSGETNRIKNVSDAVLIALARWKVVSNRRKQAWCD